jgi:hypothetical protein
LEIIAFFILLVILVIIAFVLFKNKAIASKFLNQGTIWLLLSVFFYVGLIVFSGTTSGHNRSSGYMRYFIAIQVFIIPILLLFLFQLKAIKGKFYLLFVVFFSLFSIYSFISGINKNRVYITNLQKQQTDTELYKHIKNKVTESDLLLSNTNNFVGFYSRKQCLYVEHPDRIRLLLTDWWKKPYDRVFIAINKEVGISFRLPYPDYKEILSALPHFEIIYENKNYVLVELDKETIFKEAGK